MTAPAKSTAGEGWWWAWRAWLVLGLLWLGACLWLGREAAPWSKGWVGWWTGDREGARPLWSLKAYLPAGAEVVSAEGDAAFRFGGTAFARLGHWRSRTIPATWAGWVRVTTTNGVWPTERLWLRQATAPGSVGHIGLEAGRPWAALDTFSTGNAELRVKADLMAKEPVALGRWVHLAFTTDGVLLRLLVNGVPVAEQRNFRNHGAAFYLAALNLSAGMTGPGNGVVVEQDDVVLFDRVLSPVELASWAARGRGAWVKELDRSAVAAKVWGWGWPVALGSLALLLALQTRPRWRHWLEEAGGAFWQPAFRPMRWVLLCGAVISLVLTVALDGNARRADEARFSEMSNRIQEETHGYWSDVAGLLFRARDWLAAQTNVTQRGWEAWLEGNHFPHDFPAVLGVGYAEQVLPGELAAHEARWSAQQGFAYHVHPPAGPEREPVLELEGNPQMPVVLYGPMDLKPERWLTNHTILGRDLLYRRKDDPRTWCEGRRVEALTARNEISPSGLEVIAPAAWYGKEIEGLRLYAPWTLRTKPHDGTALESRSWRGVVFASVDVRAALKARFSEEKPLLGFRYHIGTLGGHAREPLADSGELLPGTEERPEALLRRRLDIPLYHQRLLVDLWATDAFEAQSMRRWARIAGGAGGAITLLAAALLFVQARGRTRQQRVLEALSAANSELLLTYREREEMSRDLHDGSIQNLYALGLHLQRVQQVFATTPARVGDELKNSLEMLNQSIVELRRFILSSGVDNLAQSTVPAALETLVERLRKTTAMEVQLHVHPGASALEPRIGVQVINVVREATSNALRHAGARRIEIRLEPIAPRSNGHPLWRLEIADDGRGFDPSQTGGNGHGLKNLAARANELSGSSRLESTPGGGTRVTLEFPS